MIFVRALPEEVPCVWSVCRPLLNKSFFRRVHTYCADDLYAPLLTNEFQLWTAIREQKIIGAAVTALEDGPEAKVCSVLNLGGEDFALWAAQLDEEICRFASENGCIAVEAVTRRGFSRYIPDFIEDGIVYVKLLKGAVNE